MDTLNREHPLILVEQLIASHRKYRAAYRNSKGAAFLTEGGAYRVEIMYSGHQGEQSSSFFSTSLTLTTWTGRCWSAGPWPGTWRTWSGRSTPRRWKGNSGAR